ncbi:MAG: TIGR03960 family B12-binding radical SAM protein [Clostridia bacterium]
MTELNNRYEELLLSVQKPARYSGGEYNSCEIKKAEASFCLCFPDVYEVAISNLGNKIIYHMINETTEYSCERCYSPWEDMAALLREKNLPLFSLETRTPLGEFDALGISLSYEMSYTNALDMLALSNIPLHSVDRNETHPLVFAGGVCVVNPEPLWEFMDFFVLGEGETNLTPVLDIIKSAKKDKLSRIETLKKINELEFTYVPMLHDEIFENGKYLGLTNSPHTVKAIVQDLDKAFFPTKQIVPNIEAVHDRAVLEVFRGCPRGCRFCQAAFCYRPIRCKTPETLIDSCEKMIKQTGFDEISLSSLSTGDYPSIIPTLKGVSKVTLENNVRLSLPSLRLDSFDSEFVTDMKKTSALTFAPEAGTQRLRDVINKNITVEEFENAMRQAFETGYKSVKLYFMIGLPTETDEDVKGIYEMAMRVKEIYRSVVHKKDVNISCSVANFVPKPFTPFMWEKQDTAEEFKRKHQLLRELFFKTGMGLKYHDAFTSKLEGVFALGGRKTSKLLDSAYKNGCRFDGWTEFFNKEAWQKSLDECGMDMDELTKGYSFDDVLPWYFIDVGTSENFLKKENITAKTNAVTGDCMQNCLGCGANKLGECKVCW